MDIVFLNVLKNSVILSCFALLMLIFLPQLKKQFKTKLRRNIWLIIAVLMIYPLNLHMPKINTYVNINVKDKNIIKEEFIPNLNDNTNLIEDNNTDTALENNNKDTSNIHKEDQYYFDQNIPVYNYEKSNLKDKLTDFLLNITVMDILGFIWFFGVLFSAFRLIYGYWKFKREINKNSYLFLEDYSIFNNAKKFLQIDGKIPVYKCDIVHSPMMIGFFNPKIIISNTDFEENELRAVIYHELTHYKNKDVLYKYILAAAGCVNWFNPIFWMMNSQAQIDVELYCDETSTQNTDQSFKGIYCESILKVASAGCKNNMALTTSFSNDKKTIAVRFKNIFDNNIKKTGTVILVALSLCCAVSVMFTFLNVSLDIENNTVNIVRRIPKKAQEAILNAAIIGADQEMLQDPHLALSYLNLYGVLENGFYTAEGNSGFKYDYDQMLEVADFFVSENIDINEELAQPNMTYSKDWGTIMRYSAEIVSYEVLDDAVTARVKRTDSSGAPYNDIEITVVKDEVDTVPAEFENIFQIGDDIYRVSKIKQLPVEVIEGKTIYINSAQEFLNFVDDINQNGYFRYNNTYILTTDIDLQGITIQPIGVLQKGFYYEPLEGDERYLTGGFNACFNGNNHVIKNFTLDYSNVEPTRSVGYTIPPLGLFSTISEGGVVKNLILKNVNINAETENVYAGLLAGYCEGGKIINCHVLNGTLKGYSTCGGLIGDIHNGEIYSSSAQEVNLDVSSNSGGLVGHSYNSIISECYASGMVTAQNKDILTPYRIGGFSGELSYTQVNYCTNDVGLNIMDNARAIGAFSGSYETSSVQSSKIKSIFTGNWDMFGYVSRVVDGKHVTDLSTIEYDIEPY